MEYKLFFTSGEYFSRNVYNSLEAAKKAAKNTGFKCIVYEGDNKILSYDRDVGFLKI